MLIAVLIIGCNKKPENNTSTNTNTTSTPKSKDELVKLGKELYYMHSNNNNIACVDCHSDGTNDDKPLTKYFSSIKGAAKRTSAFLGAIKKEDITKTATGATNCWERFLKQKNPMNAEQIASLNAYYESVSKGDEPTEIKYTSFALPAPNKEKLKPEQDAVLKMTGDKDKGEKTFNSACAFCHGDKSTIKNVDNLFDDFEGNPKSITFMARIGKKSMPFFNTETLSNQDIADVSAFILAKNKK